MKMRKMCKSLSAAVGLVALIGSACSAPLRVEQVKADYIAIDTCWDAMPHAAAEVLLAPYAAYVDSVMNEVVGRSKQMMDRGRPEDLLQNLVADVLRMSAREFIGRKADVGLVNIGGIRAALPQGNLTVGNIYEILPFENSLCILTLRGDALQQLFEQISMPGGEGVSGANLVIDKQGKLLDACVDGKPIDPVRLYTVATVDYLAEGNDRMTACLQAVERICPEGKTLRGLFLDYVKVETAAGREIDARLEGRIKVVP